MYHPHPIIYKIFNYFHMCTGKHTAKTTVRLEELQDTESEDNSEAGTGPQQSTGVKQKGKILFQ